VFWKSTLKCPNQATYLLKHIKICTVSFTEPRPNFKNFVFFLIHYNKCFQQMRLCFLSLFHIYLLSPYMFRAFIGPSSRVSWAVVFMLPFGSCSVCWPSVCLANWFLEVRKAQDGQQTLHEPNGSIKQQLKTPPMINLWRPETCRVREDIWNKDKKLSRICWKHLL
jgi:hypothetical protein